MNAYMSIGELSQLSGSSIRSLRYYDEIGILQPAYINPETKYRYYTMDQMKTLAVIQACTELDIPLKRFKDYQIEAGAFDLQRLVHDGEEIAQEKICHMKQIAAKLDSISEGLSTIQNLKQQRNPYRRKMTRRNFLIAPFEGEITNEYHYIKAFTDLFAQAERAGLTVLFQQGILMKCGHPNPLCYAFLEIEEHRDGDTFLSISQDTYECSLYPAEDFGKRYISILDKQADQDTLMLFVEYFTPHMQSLYGYIEAQKIPWRNAV